MERSGVREATGSLREMQSQQLSLDSKHALVTTNYEGSVRKHYEKHFLPEVLHFIILLVIQQRATLRS